MLTLHPGRNGIVIHQQQSIQDALHAALMATQQAQAALDLALGCLLFHPRDSARRQHSSLETSGLERPGVHTRRLRRAIRAAFNDRLLLTLQETRYRQRYLDGIVNHDSMRSIFVTRARIIQAVRKYFDERDFVEVRYGNQWIESLLEALYEDAASQCPLRTLQCDIPPCC